MIPWVTAALLAAMPADTILLRVLAIADFHGGLEPATVEWSNGRLVGGIAALASAMDAAEAECGCPTIRVDAGDEMQGTLISNLVFGRSSVDVLNRLGIDAAAIGNHDLDWGVDTLRARMREARYPWLAANIVDSLRGTRVPWARPSAVVEIDGIDVGVIGYLTASSKQLIATQRSAGLTFGEGAEWVRDEIRRLRARSVDVVLLLAHASAFCDADGCRGELARLARDLGPDRVDLMIGGHTDATVEGGVRGMPILKPGNGGFTLGVVDLVRHGDGTLRSRMRIDTVYADRYPPAPALAAVVARHRAGATAVASRPVATLAEPLLVDGSQYPLGNLIADAQRAAADADVGFVNNGGIRRSLDVVEVTYGALFAVLPFDNQLVRLTVTGAVLRAALEHAIDGRGPHAHISGLIVRYDATAERGTRVGEVRLSDGRALEPDRLYTIGMPDFIADGGDGYEMWRRAPRQAIGVTYRRAVIDHLHLAPQPVRAPHTQRFVPASVER